LAYGFFGFLVATVVCGAGVGLYALNLVDRKSEALLGFGGEVFENLPELREKLPPALADAINDQRDPDYRDSIELETKLAPGHDRNHGNLVINARNTGDKTVSLMAVRTVLLDANQAPVYSWSTYAATPLTVDNDWRGPLLPGSTRRCSITVRCDSSRLTPEAEITELRVWTGESTPFPAAEAAQ
jgi:hypothetical protein